MVRHSSLCIHHSSLPYVGVGVMLIVPPLVVTPVLLFSPTAAMKSVVSCNE